MFHRLHGFRRTVITLSAGSLLIFLLAADLAAAGNSRLLVFLEVPGSVIPAELALDGLELRNGEHAVPLPLEAGDLVAGDLAGKPYSCSGGRPRSTLKLSSILRTSKYKYR